MAGLDQFAGAAGDGKQGLAEDEPNKNGTNKPDWNEATTDPDIKTTDKQFLKGSVTLPIYYATDREWLGHTYVGKRDASKERTHHLEYGTTFVTVPIKEKLPPNYSDLGWKPDEHKLQRPRFENIERSNFQDFYTRVPQICKSADPDEIVLFVPGYKNSFERASKEAAQLSYYFRKPVFLYAWPSVNRYLGYRKDEGNVEWSKRHFELFLEQLTKSAGGAQFLTVVSHSMGIRLLNSALKERAHEAQIRAKVYDELKLEPVSKDPPHFKELMLVSPDIDREVLQNYWWRVTANSEKVRPWISDKDKALRLSSLINGYIRAGLLLDPKSHERLPPLPGTETIDFTIVDKSLVPRSLFTKLVPIDFGHQIPALQMRNMHDSDEPGNSAKGRKLTLEKTVIGKGRLYKIKLDNGKTSKIEHFECPNQLDLDCAEQ